MKAEIISIGSEITSGQNLDTNSQWLSKRLAEMGIPVGFHTTVADDLDDNIRCFQQAIERADLVIATGGLGPTQDDLTREVLAKMAGVALVEDPASLEVIQQMFAKRNREMPERNRLQAFFPEGRSLLQTFAAPRREFGCRFATSTSSPCRECLRKCSSCSTSK